MTNPEKDGHDFVELFLGFGNTVIVMPPGLLFCLPQMCLVGTIHEKIAERRVVLDSVVWRKRN